MDPEADRYKRRRTIRSLELDKAPSALPAHGDPFLREPPRLFVHFEHGRPDRSGDRGQMGILLGLARRASRAVARALAFSSLELRAHRGECHHAHLIHWAPRDARWNTNHGALLFRAHVAF